MLKVYCEFRKKFLLKGMATREVNLYNNTNNVRENKV
tara:strand:- start:192 stop:302 length:111 start_codon:yes stop_codon:yes gene_type:complete